MKQKSSIIVLVIVLSMLFCGCHNKEHKCPVDFDDGSYTYDIKVMDISDGAKVMYAESKYSFADEKRFTDQPPETIKISVDNEIFEGTYIDSQYRNADYYPMHRYFGRDSKSPIKEIGLTPDGKLVSCYYGFNYDNTDILDQRQCVEIARKFVSAVHDITNYKVEIEINENLSYYRVNFIKYVENYPTTDMATIVVQFNGNIVDYVGFMLGKIPEDTKIYLDEAKADKVVQNQINAIQQSTEFKEKYQDAQSRIISRTVTITSEGKAVMLVEVDFEYRIEEKIHNEKITVCVAEHGTME